MSGYCLECGNDICVCDELEEEAKKQPDVMFICQRKEIEKLQEENKIMRDALEFISTLDNKVLVGQEIKDLPKTISGITARETLAKIDKQGEG